ALSRTTSTLIYVPLVETEAPLSRGQFEQLAQPILARTVSAARAALAEAGVLPGNLFGVFLVGGSSRIPLVVTLLHRSLGVFPTVVGNPELAVAEGSVRT